MTTGLDICVNKDEYIFGLLVRLELHVRM